MRAALLALLVSVPASADVMDDYLDGWRRGAWEEMHARLSPQIQAKWPLADFSRFWPAEPGAVLRRSERRDGELRVLEAEVIAAEAVFVVRLGADDAGRVRSLKVSPEGASPYPARHSARTVLFPFAPGETWRATGEHHLPVRSQRFAYDLVVVRDGQSFLGDAALNESYFCYGREILSPADAEVIETHDGTPDNVPGTIGPGLGNYVMLEAAGELHLFLTHMKPGSVRVAAGQTVKAGQVLGLVGNSGRSSEPHLHIEAFDSQPRTRADAYPLAFSNAGGAPLRYGDLVRAETLTAGARP